MAGTGITETFSIVGMCALLWGILQSLIKYIVGKKDKIEDHTSEKLDRILSNQQEQGQDIAIMKSTLTNTIKSIEEVKQDEKNNKKDLAEIKVSMATLMEFRRAQLENK